MFNLRKVFIVAFALIAFCSFVPLSYSAVYSSISGRVLDAETKQPVENASLQILNEEYRWVTVLTSKEGKFSVRHLPPDTYIFLVHGPDNSFYANNRKRLIVTLPKGKDVINANFLLIKGGAIEGTVYQADGITPAVNIPIMINDDLSELGDFEGSAGARTDANGKYFLKPVPVTAKAVVEIPTTGKGVLRKTATVQKEQITQGIDFILKWDETTGIKGTVTSAIDGKPIKGAKVRIYIPYIKNGEAWSDDVTVIRTDDIGNFLIAGLQAETYSLRVVYAVKNAGENSAKTYSEVKDNIVISEGQQNSLNISINGPSN